MAEISQMIDEMPRKARTALAGMAAESGADSEAVLMQVACEYLNLASDIPDALPNTKLRRMATKAMKGVR